MPRPVTDLDRDNFVNLYLTGLSYQRVAAQTGFGPDQVRLVLLRRGVLRSLSDARASFFANGGQSPALRTDLPEQEIVARYAAGESGKGLSVAYGADLKAIRRIVTAAGLEWRNTQQARRLIDRVTSGERGALTGQRDLLRLGWGEDLVHQALIDLGESPHRQHAEGTKNIDVALWPVAVEIWLSSSFPTRDPYCLSRIKYLGDRNWTCLYVLVSRRTRKLDAPAVAQQAIAIKKLTESDPAARREHRVIRGTGELTATYRVDGDHRA